SYELVINRGLTDAYGRALTETIRKSFTVVKPDQQSPDPTNWSLSIPSTATHDPLVVALDDAIDPILATRLVRIEDTDGHPIPGIVTLDDNETTLSITPEETWSSGMYRLAVSRTLEDYAGNRIESLFDMAQGTVAALATTADERDPIFIEFNIRADGMQTGS
ncbi:MAG: Ig-like domain-containing protein, partial [Cyanobacteria bacterium J06607_13]